jgi:hypothetical protein
MPCATTHWTRGRHSTVPRCRHSCCTNSARVSAGRSSKTRRIDAYPLGLTPIDIITDQRMFVGTNTVREDAGMFRLDYRFTDNTTAYALYNVDNAYIDKPTDALGSLNVIRVCRRVRPVPAGSRAFPADASRASERPVRRLRGLQCPLPERGASGGAAEAGARTVCVLIAKAWQAEAPATLYLSSSISVLRDLPARSGDWIQRTSVSKFT